MRLRREWAAVAVLTVVIGAGCSSSDSDDSSGDGAGAVAAAASDDSGAPIGLTATGSGKQTVTPDRAFVVVAPGGADEFLSGDGSSELSQRDRDDVRAAVEKLGIDPAQAVEFADGSDSGLGGATVTVAVPVAGLPKVATDVATAVEEIVGDDGTKGLRFGVADCAAAISTARDDAIAQAHENAESLAAAADVKLGGLLSLNEGGAGGAAASPLDYLSAYDAPSPCTQDSAASVASFLGDSFGLAELDAKAEVEVPYSVSATYAIGARSATTISATGDGEAEADADVVDIVVVSSGEESFTGAKPISDADSEKIMGALRALNVEEEGIEVESSTSPVSTSYVTARIPVSRLDESGPKIVDAIEEVMGDGGESGALFGSSKCKDLLKDARAKAVTDAIARIDALAKAGKVKAGAVVGLSESPFNLATVTDPCEPDVSQLSTLGGISFGAGGSGPSLQPLDAEPHVEYTAAVIVTRAMSK